jgi:hypothetical protein
MTRLSTEIHIPAPREQVWAVLTDFAAYPQWSPTIQAISGALQVGSRLTVRILGPGNRAATVAPTVLAVQPNHLLRWDAVLLHRGLLSGVHEFRLSDADEGSTRLIQSDTYTGLLAAPLGRLLAANESLMRRQNTALHGRVLSATAVTGA